jgi:predicted nucleotidyltransferase component of viral defense system
MKTVLMKLITPFNSHAEKYNFAREYLQELVLQIIDRHGYFANLAFVGGTALRILYDLPRFSEDLDFSLINNKDFVFPSLLKTIKKELELNGYEIEEAKHKEKTVLSDFIRFKGLLYELGLSKQSNEKLFIKLEVDSRPPSGYETEVVLANKNFLFKVVCYKADSLFASKLHAILFRNYEKGRDYYDLLWFLTRKTPINYLLLSNAANQTEKTASSLDAARTKNLLLAKIEGANFANIIRDMRPFLEKSAEVEYFKKDYFLGAIEKYFA